MSDSNKQLLLACARPALDQSQAKLIRELLSQPIDWQLLLQQASWHCVRPLLYANLQAAAPDLAPPLALASLRSHFEDNFRHNLFLSGQMLQLVKKFEERKVPVIAYKGPALCGYYRNLGLREFGDLDFLVAPKDVQRANEILHSEGFRPHLYTPCPQEARALPFARAFHNEMVYTSADSKTKVDLHWTLMPGFWALADHAGEVWDRLQRLPVAGSSVATLGHEDTLLLLCAHGAKHMWRSLGWISDLAAVLHSIPGLDWAAIFERAARLRVKRALGLGLFLASDLLGSRLPAEAHRLIQEDAEIGKLAASVRAALFAGQAADGGVLASCLFLMRTRENTRDALRCGLERVFQPTMAEWHSIALPRILFPAYYFLRPMRLLTKHGLRD
jgi:hypothetical protein